MNAASLPAGRPGQLGGQGRLEARGSPAITIPPPAACALGVNRRAMTVATLTHPPPAFPGRTDLWRRVKGRYVGDRGLI